MRYIFVLFVFILGCEDMNYDSDAGIDSGPDLIMHCNFPCRDAQIHDPSLPPNDGGLEQ